MFHLITPAWPRRRLHAVHRLSRPIDSWPPSVIRPRRPGRRLPWSSRASRRKDVSILRGEEGAARLDGTGATHGAVGRTRRLVSFTLMDQLPDLAWYEAAVRDGGAVVMVRVRGDDRKRAAIAIVREHGGHFLNYYGRFATEEVSRWTGPEPEVSDLLKR